MLVIDCINSKSHLCFFLSRLLQGNVLFNDANQNPLGTESLEFGGNEADASFKTVRLRDRLNEADTERRKAEEEALARERAAEMRREERLKKIAYMNDMPDDQPAGTGMFGPMLCHRLDSLYVENSLSHSSSHLSF